MRSLDFWLTFFESFVLGGQFISSLDLCDTRARHNGPIAGPLAASSMHPIVIGDLVRRVNFDFYSKVDLFFVFV